MRRLSVFEPATRPHDERIYVPVARRIVRSAQLSLYRNGPGIAPGRPTDSSLPTGLWREIFISGARVRTAQAMSSATADEGAFTVRQRLFAFAAVLVVTFLLVLVLGFAL